MTKIGIDQSFKNTAYCLFENDVLIDFGVIKTVGKSKDGLETDYADRISRITEEIVGIINKNKVEEVSFEGLSMAKNSTTARPLGWPGCGNHRPSRTLGTCWNTSNASKRGRRSTCLLASSGRCTRTACSRSPVRVAR